MYTSENNVKWHLPEKLVALVENNNNVCEFEAGGIVKSYVYKDISPDNILVLGGQSTVQSILIICYQERMS